MTRPAKNSFLDRGARHRGARAIVGSRLHNHYAAVLAEPMPPDLTDLVAQLVALEACKDTPHKTPVQVLQLASSPPGQRW